MFYSGASGALRRRNGGKMLPLGEIAQLGVWWDVIGCWVLDTQKKETLSDAVDAVQTARYSQRERIMNLKAAAAVSIRHEGATDDCCPRRREVRSEVEAGTFLAGTPEPLHVESLLILPNVFHGLPTHLDASSPPRPTVSATPSSGRVSEGSSGMLAWSHWRSTDSVAALHKPQHAQPCEQSYRRGWSMLFAYVRPRKLRGAPHSSTSKQGKNHI
eukprot:scaffold2394_cov276-Pinguiococcus_pyrenoidosus.AAC.8